MKAADLTQGRDDECGCDMTAGTGRSAHPDGAPQLHVLSLLRDIYCDLLETQQQMRAHLIISPEDSQKCGLYNC